ncbi:MAG: phosphoribosylglycinamide formyltransferase [Bacteroidetes bacterium]|jgi:phosphoribosylglycinamide formyltransferase-1|nr:phosphoribosylglycinamide formyltransferase [Bacteroidota bacterium]
MRLALFASGGGTNCQAILDAIAEGTLDATAVCLIADRAGCGALQRADAAGLPSHVIAPGSYADAPAFGQALLETLDGHDATFVALAGYLSKIPPVVVDAFTHRMLNVHPALLPAFGGQGMYGRHVHEAVLAYGSRWSGVTIHVVDEQYDHGPVVLQEPVPVYPDDTPDTLARRIHPVEHRLYPHALQRFAAGEVRIDGRHVRFTPPHAPSSPEPTHD